MTDVNVAAERVCLWAHVSHPRGTQAAWGPVSALSLTSCVTLSVPQYLHL